MQLEEKVKQLPTQPGVYLFHNSQGEIIYVGKAVSLRQRVRSYFQSGGNQSPKTQALVEKIKDMEYIVTDSEVEALILECNLIKEHRPRYNVLLKDDKTYPYIKITLGEEYPRVLSTRRVVKDGSRYFGPYTQVGAMRETLKLIKRLFPLRSCGNKQFAARSRPCLNYHIQRCQAPCCHYVEQEAYARTVAAVVLFLEGREAELMKSLEKSMHQAAASLQFEKAAELRDQLQAVKKVVQKQKIVSEALEDEDVIALARGLDQVCVMVFFIRGGKLIGRDSYFVQNTEELSRGEVMAQFFKQYYSRVETIPTYIRTAEDLGEEEKVITDWLSMKNGKKVHISRPQRGEKAKLAEMVEQNALLVLKEKEQEIESGTSLAGAMEQLAEALGLKAPPRRMECYDISNIQGAEQVASMVVFEEGQPRKEAYRRFKIKTVEGPNDFASMQEVIGRRFARGLEEKKLIQSGQLSSREAKFNQFPDLVIIDGGRGQLSAARFVMERLGVDYIATFGLAKEEELLFAPDSPEPIRLPKRAPALKLIQRLRDEAHRFAITYHRTLRTKRNLKSLLDEIEGIGPVRKKALLQRFKNLSEMETASLEELLAVKGMNNQAAEAVYQFFRRQK